MSGKVKTYKAGVKEYRETYWMPEYTPNETDILACFKITPQAGVPREEAAAAVAAESSTGTWTTAALPTGAQPLSLAATSATDVLIGGAAGQIYAQKEFDRLLSRFNYTGVVSL